MASGDICYENQSYVFAINAYHRFHTGGWGRRGGGGGGQSSHPPPYVET